MHRSSLSFVIHLVTCYDYIYRPIICTEGIKAWSPQVQALGSLDTPLQRLMIVTRVD